MDSRFIELIFLILMVVPSVYLKTEEDEMVANCIYKAKKFAEHEEQYVDKRKVSIRGGPKTTRHQDKYLQHDVYYKGQIQAPFECISKCVKKYPYLNIKKCDAYKDLVKDCKSKWAHVKCDPDCKYRSFRGTCNNLSHKHWGSLYVCLKRLLPQNYEGTAGFRKSVNGGPLPQARQISLSLHSDKNQPTKDLAHIHTFFGQFLSHDITDVPKAFVRYRKIDCCSNPHGPHHPHCAPILIGNEDPFYSQFNITCIDFFRSSPCDSCCYGKRNQLNQATAYIDLSGVYGLTKEKADFLRTDGAKLRVQSTEVGDLLPVDESTNRKCGSEQKGEYCFLAGDRRANQQPALMSLHTLFVREHNRIVDELRRFNPYKSDEFIYQYARDINIAQMQVIVYNEFLPPLIGDDMMTNYDLWIQPSGCTTYDPTVNPNIYAEFNTAAYRLHSMIGGIVTNYGEIDPNKKLLRNHFSEAAHLYEGRMGALLEGMCMTPAQRNDRHVSEDMRHFMYKSRKAIFGFDIASFNIQRGRDNGLPTYAEVIYYFNEVELNSFGDLQEFMDEENIDILKNVYEDVKDIDLWVGMLNEKVSPGMLVGPTTAEIIALQLSNLKKGDRFYFEHCGHTRFNNEQLETLRKTSLSSLLCLNTDIQATQLKAMLLPSYKNPVKCCHNIPRVDLSLFTGIGKCKTKYCKTVHHNLHDIFGYI